MSDKFRIVLSEQATELSFFANPQIPRFHRNLSSRVISINTVALTNSNFRPARVVSKLDIKLVDMSIRPLWLAVVDASSHLAAGRALPDGCRIFFKYVVAPHPTDLPRQRHAGPAEKTNRTDRELLVVVVRLPCSVLSTAMCVNNINRISNQIPRPSRRGGGTPPQGTRTGELRQTSPRRTVTADGRRPIYLRHTIFDIDPPGPCR
ncbi:hypothetical protein EVAR_9774_1 [Eumeta japonica]|uniref:Uncharacterized protein n=1 Tax=Eumeta variegata TaxID=151549 RepID=A0A4C1U5K8_EUMVA|nr:hypothetical protein EVAR_9774_1 [Eumeta japonica]